jgi:proteasome accessory factor B
VEFELATRTIKRDIEFMRERLKLPIEFDRRKKGFFYSRPVKYFPAVPLSEAEMFALLVAQKAIAQYHDTPFEQPLTAAYRRLTRQLSDRVNFSLEGLGQALSFQPFAPGDADLLAFERISSALTQQLEVTFTYRNHGAQTPQKRRVRPYHLACIQNQWYLIGFDVRREDLRTFVLTRLWSPAVTAKRFTMPPDFSIEDYLEGSFSVLR